MTTTCSKSISILTCYTYLLINSFYSEFVVILVCDSLAVSGNESLANFKNVTANQCVRQTFIICLYNHKIKLLDYIYRRLNSIPIKYVD